jgi:hypothetical protein
MKILYIPTSSFNFNGILSTGNLSPASFYSLRNYGVRSISKIRFNQLDNCLLAYDHVLHFDNKGHNENDFPIFLGFEVNDNNKNEIQHIGNFDGIEVYRISGPVYITSKSSFVFRSRVEKETAINNSLRELKAKFTDQVYSQCKSLESNTELLIKQVSIEYEVTDISLNRTALHKDMIYNRIKGLYMGYLIGRFNSDSDDWTMMKIQVNEIKVSTQTLLQDLSLTSGSVNKSTLNLRVRKLGEIIRSNLNALNELLNKDHALKSRLFEQYFDEVCKKLGISVKCEDFTFLVYGLLQYNKKLLPESFFNIVMQGARIGISNIINEIDDQLNTLIDKSSPRNLDSGIMSELIKQVKALEVEFTKLHAEAQKLNEEPEDPSELIKFGIDMQVRSIKTNEEFDHEPLIIFLNYLIDHLELDSKTSLQNEFKNAIIDKLGSIYSEFFKDEWKDTAERKYLLTLKNIVNGKAVDFNLKNTSDIILKSMASFILKPECVSEMMEMMERNNIPDKSIAAAIWGAINGYSGIPKTIFIPWHSSQSESFHVQLNKKLESLLQGLKNYKLSIYQDDLDPASKQKVEQANEDLESIISITANTNESFHKNENNAHEFFIVEVIEKIKSDKKLLKFIDWISKCILEFPERYSHTIEGQFQNMAINEDLEKKEVLKKMLTDKKNKPDGFGADSAEKVARITFGK